ncbi:hypothetical protein MHAS_01996 [Mycolicibacterium hassiacum DSM 44199]|nr:hypothetical protein MHAS_01996 [Mycolicibacterium hassiacum DSM 44199]
MATNSAHAGAASAWASSICGENVVGHDAPAPDAATSTKWPTA